MIQEFSITNTYSIKERQNISFEAAFHEPGSIHYCKGPSAKKLLKMAVVYGANASGKSNLIKAFDFYCAFIKNGFTKLKPNEETGFVPFAFDEQSKINPGTFEIVFYLNDIKYEYCISLDTLCVHEESLSYSPKGQRKLFFRRVFKNDPENRENPEYTWKWGDAFTGNKNNISGMTRSNVSFLNTAAQLGHKELSAVHSFFNDCLSIFPLFNEFFESAVNQFDSYEEKLKKEAMDFLSSAGFGHIDDIIIKEQEIPASFVREFSEILKLDLTKNKDAHTYKNVFLSHKYRNNYLLPLGEESEGTKRLINLAIPLTLLFKEWGFLCIDEIEFSLHQELVEFIIRTFLEKSSSSQLLFTTHNVDLLESGLLRDDEIWFSEKGENGGTSYTSLAEYKGVRKGASRKKLYLAGKFGALPIMSEYVSEP